MHQQAQSVGVPHLDRVGFGPRRMDSADAAIGRAVIAHGLCLGRQQPGRRATIEFQPGFHPFRCLRHDETLRHCGRVKQPQVALAASHYALHSGPVVARQQLGNRHWRIFGPAPELDQGAPCRHHLYRRAGDLVVERCNLTQLHPGSVVPNCPACKQVLRPPASTSPCPPRSGI